jgi:hypothetical protein
MRIAAIISYLFIFLPGSMILVPFGCLLVDGLISGEPIMKVLILLADLSIVFWLYTSSKPKTIFKLALEILFIVLLLLPIIKILMDWPLNIFNYFLFIAPFVSFIFFSMVSLIITISKLRTNNISNNK